MLELGCYVELISNTGVLSVDIQDASPNNGDVGILVEFGIDNQYYSENICLVYFFKHGLVTVYKKCLKKV